MKKSLMTLGLGTVITTIGGYLFVKNKKDKELLEEMFEENEIEELEEESE